MGGQVTVRRDPDGWWVARCPNYHRPGNPPLLGCEQWWEDAMEIANDHCPTGRDPAGDCEPASAVPSSSPTPNLGRNITTPPDIDRYPGEEFS